jgi:hypothetical protein
MHNSIYRAFYFLIVIRFLRTTVRKILVPHRKFRNKYKFGLYAVPKGEHVTLHFANVYVDDPSDMDNSTLFHDLGVTMSKCHVFAIADGSNEYPFHQFIQPDKYNGQLSVSLDMKTVVLTVDHILYDFAGPNDYDFFF